jgi:hypothetical protein
MMHVSVIRPEPSVSGTVRILSQPVRAMSQGHNCNESWGHVTPASPSVHRTPRLPPNQRRSLSPALHVHAGLCSRTLASARAPWPLLAHPGLCMRTPASARAPQPLHTHPSLCTHTPAFARASRPLHAHPSVCMCVLACVCVSRPLHTHPGLCTHVPAFARAFRPLHVHPSFCMHIPASAHVLSPQQGFVHT